MQSVLQKSILFILIIAGYCTQAQVKFSATISPAEIGKDEYAQLKLMVENANEVQQIVPPSLNKFIILSGPNQESGMTMINGVVKKYIAINFIIKPKTTGVFTIPPALAKADGGDYKSNSVTIKVSANATGNSPSGNVLVSPFSTIDPFEDVPARSTYNDHIIHKGENPHDKIKKNMFLRVEVDKKSCFVGEPVVASYKLYTRLQSESNLIKNPSFNGFSVVDLQQPNDMQARIEKFEGREYNVYYIRKVQLYPLLHGNLELGIAEIENKVQFIKAEYANQQSDFLSDMFRDFANATIPAEGLEVQHVSLQSKPLSVLVKPLPVENKPADFKGAVGRFAVETRVEKNNFSTDDAGKMAIIISGSGNLQLVNAPDITWPPGMEVFDSKATDDLFKGTVPVSGRKIFEFPFSVAKAGTYSIPAVSFSFFDIHDSKYKTVTSAPIEITVTKGTGKPIAIIAGNKIPDTNGLVQLFNNRLRVVSFFAVLIIIGLIVWLKRDTKKEKKLNKETETQEKEEAMMPVEEIILAQENPLSAVEACLHAGDPKIFYVQLNLALKNYLAKKLSIPAETLNRKTITEQLDANGISNETAVQLLQLMDDIEWQLYTPVAEDEKMKGMYERAHDLIQLLNTYHSR